MLPEIPTVRIARPTDNLRQLTRQYTEGLGFKVLGSFVNHDGFDGFIIGHDLQPYHFEFTYQHGTKVGTAPTKDHLIAFYVARKSEWVRKCDEMLKAGFQLVESCNPYWDVNGKTFEDIDGYRVVLQNA